MEKKLDGGLIGGRTNTGEKVVLAGFESVPQRVQELPVTFKENWIGGYRLNRAAQNFLRSPLLPCLNLSVDLGEKFLACHLLTNAIMADDLELSDS